jgi:hypothetical protein
MMVCPHWQPAQCDLRQKCPLKGWEVRRLESNSRQRGREPARIGVTESNNLFVGISPEHVTQVCTMYLVGLENERAEKRECDAGTSYTHRRFATSWLLHRRYQNKHSRPYRVSQNSTSQIPRK